MSKQVVLTMKLESELRENFMAEAANEDRSASQIMREYDEYLREKVELGRASMREGLGRSNDEVEAIFAAKRNAVG